MNITGYADELRVEAGQSLGFRISSDTNRYEARLVRLLHGDPNPAGPGFKTESVTSNLDGVHPGKAQPVHLGSYAIIKDRNVFQQLSSITLAMWIWPTRPGGQRQTLFSRAGDALSLDLDESGRVELRLSGHPVARLERPVEARQWAHLSLRLGAGDQGVQLRLSYRDWRPDQTQAIQAACDTKAWPKQGDLTFAAQLCGRRATHHYNGKIENPELYARGLSDAGIGDIVKGAEGKTECEPTCLWDFARSMATDRILDTGPNRCHGKLINMPTRSVTGHNWTGDTPDPGRVPSEYGAIHFHDDDLGDAGWSRSLKLDTSADMRSGIYALHLKNDHGEDHIPFVVTPPQGQAQSDVLFLMPTLTYLAYGNEAIANRPDMREMMAAAGIDKVAPYPVEPEDKYIAQNQLLSCYDLHSDGSGVCYSSKKRPLLSMRPSYRMPLLGLQVDPGGAPHQLSADLCIADWMDAQGVQFDVATDEDLDRDGADLLSRYKVVVTGSHPEYYTRNMFDGLTAYLNGGGHLMYLGGNGFFWVTSISRDGKAIETRRSRTVRPWTCLPGEEFHSTTGELGGAWKFRARSAQKLVGVGTTAVGFTSGRAYTICDGARESAYGWALDGVEGTEFGGFPNLIYGDGAAGWEIDRADPALGTPSGAVTLASARLEDDSYQLVVDECEAAGPHNGGVMNPNVRADLVMTPFPNDGAAFSVSSCMWAGALSYNGYDNDVSRITANVLHRFRSKAVSA